MRLHGEPLATHLAGQRNLTCTEVCWRGFCSGRGVVLSFSNSAASMMCGLHVLLEPKRLPRLTWEVLRLGPLACILNARILIARTLWIRTPHTYCRRLAS